MKKNITLVLLTYISLVGALNASESSNQAFLGHWEHRQINPEMKNGFDPEGEKLELDEVGGNIVGSYFGIEREGDEVLYYTAVKLKDIKITGNHISFTVPARELFSERPLSADDGAKKSKTSIGFTRTDLTMGGKLENGKLVLHCTSIDDACPADELSFKKGK